MPGSTVRVRTALFTPGTEAERLRKASSSGADVCIFDLEDSVPGSRIAEARQTVADAVRELANKARIWVRVHSASTQAMLEDLTALPLNAVAGLVLPKVGGAAELVELRTAILASKGPSELPLVPIIESAAGVLNAGEIASNPDVFCMALGRFDLSADVGIDPDSESPVLTAARAAVVLNSAAHGLRPPLDSPWIRIKDLDGLRDAAAGGRRDGFGGMLLIHPSHVSIVNEVFSPTPQEVAWAREIMASNEQAGAQGRGAYAQDGAMVDEAIVRRARSILAQNGGNE